MYKLLREIENNSRIKRDNLNDKEVSKSVLKLSVAVARGNRPQKHVPFECRSSVFASAVSTRYQR